MTALRALLAGIVDYAGLFPPAGLDLAEAVRNYGAYRAGDDAWMLGRFVIPIARVDALVPLLASRGGDAPWRLAALAGDDVGRDLSRAREFNGSHGRLAQIDCVEARLADRDAIERAADAAGDLELFAELPPGADPAPLVAVLARRGLRAKLRAGGVVAESFPSTAAVIRFMRACRGAGVPFKATAGLHHPLTGTYPVTYEPGAPVHRMFGFVNLFLSAAVLSAGAADDAAAALLDETDPAALTISDGAIRWRRHETTVAALERTRESVACSFGSCSFREPADGVAALWGAS